jgi:uncharacterized membrane protein
VGLLLASALMLAGLVWYAASPPSDSTVFKLRNLWALFTAGDARSLIGLGILVLLVTPLARVGTSLLYFLKEKDRLYAGLTMVVLVNLALAVALGTVLSP